MARPSLDSPSMVELKNQAKNRRKSTPPSTSSGLSRSLLGDDETESKGISSVAPKSPPIHHSQPELSTSHSEMEHEQLKRKYSMQNQTLAKNNSIMLSKLSSMESRLSELISENVSMRRQKSLKDGAIKDTLHRKLLKIEDGLYEKFDDIFQMFEDIRSSEDLPSNPKLKVFKQTGGEETIAVRPSESAVITPVNDKSGINKQRSIEPLLEEESESPVKSVSEIEAAGQRKKRTQGEPSISVHSERREMDNTETGISSTTSEPKVAESGKSITSEPELSLFPARSKSLAPEPNLASSKRKWISTEASLSSGKRSSILPNESKTKRRRASVVNDHEHIETKSAESRISNEAPTSVSEISNEDKNKNEKEFQVFSDMPSRPRRARKEVDYKTPSLNKKMRRETEWLVTAVGNEPIIKKNLKESTPEPQQLTQALKETKSKKIEVKSELPSTKREPLQMVDINNRDTIQSKIQSKILNKQPEDLSIFDFDDEAENRAPPIRKTYKRRIQASDLRRHSML
ncbi:hypothetical protein CLIB1423_10S04148 [[Candida] railenensis]|uniref:Shugoshin C-terminal domain-containing protein n=1 Tax=[Candida] railenensis TaxID=45579 RepID=A0A9P0QR36_9ASCO|nr:hypothetical protein CLIB1423_10S04148 [[Candida] railenensis]